MKKILFVLVSFVISFNVSAEQCKAITRAGYQCSRNAKIEHYCTQHYKMYGGKQSEDKSTKTLIETKNQSSKQTCSSNQCQGITKKGNRCKNRVKNGKYCWVHSK